jgi:hypothetical protein
VNWQLELILDEPDFLRVTQVGGWIHVLGYETGEGEWEWAQGCQERSCAAEAVQSPSTPHLVPGEGLPSLPGREAILQSSKANEK